jgi:hypothetical protein
MATAWIEADLPGLFRAIGLVEDYWRAASAQGRKDAAAELRLQEMRFGLSPLDRRRLEWSIDQPEEESAATPPPQPTGTDARSILRAVK